MTPNSRDKIRASHSKIKESTGSTNIHPHDVIQESKSEHSVLEKISDSLIEHIAQVAGTAYFFWFLGLVLITWPLTMISTGGFDPYPFSFLFFILGGIMQSLFVPAVMIAQRKAEERDTAKAEVDHHIMQELVDINKLQLKILKKMSKHDKVG